MRFWIWISLLKELLEGSAESNEGKYGDFHAWIHTSAEGTADHAGTPYGRIF